MHHDIAAWFLLHGNGTCNTLGRILCACACVCVCVYVCDDDDSLDHCSMQLYVANVHSKQSGAVSCSLNTHKSKIETSAIEHHLIITQNDNLSEM